MITYRFEDETATRHENQNATKKKQQHVAGYLYEPHYATETRTYNYYIISYFRVRFVGHL